MVCIECDVEMELVVMRFEQTSEKKFNRIVDKTNAKCWADLGSGRYANYYSDDGNGRCVARIDQSLSVFEIAVDDA